MEDQAARKRSIGSDDCEDTTKTSLSFEMLTAQTEKRQVVPKTSPSSEMLTAQTEKRQVTRKRSTRTRILNSRKTSSQLPGISSPQTEERSEPTPSDDVSVVDNNMLNQSIRISLATDDEALPSLGAITEREIAHQEGIARSSIDQVADQASRQDASLFITHPLPMTRRFASPQFFRRATSRQVRSQSAKTLHKVVLVGSAGEHVDQSITQKLRTTSQALKTVRVGRIVNNTVISLLGQIVTWTSTFLLIVAYGRFLGDVKFGELYTATNIVGLIGFPIELGFNQQIIRDVAVAPSKAARYFANTVLLKFVLWLVLFGLTLLISRAIGYNAEELVLVVICGLTLLVSSVTNTFSSLYYAFERTAFPVIGSVLEKGLSALVGVILLAHGANVRVMAFVLLGGALVSCIWQAVCFFRIAGSRFVIDTSLIRALVVTSIPFILYGVLGVIYYRIDTVILSVVTNAAVVGWYGAGYRLFDTLSFLPGIVIRSIMSPIFAKLTTTSEEKLQVTIEKSTNFLLICGLPITVGLMVAAPAIISFLYHRSEFTPAVPSLQALAPGLIFLYMNTVFNTILVSTKKEKKITLMAGIALLFNLGLNCLFIPLYQHVGAAIVTSLTELLLLCLSIIFTPKNLLPKGSVLIGAKALVASVVMGFAVWGLGFLHIYSIFMLVPVAMFVYVGVALAIGTVPKEDLQALYKVVQNRVDRRRGASR